MPVQTNGKVTHPLVPTGIPGLDEILGGGLPSQRLYLIEGHPGTGKTTLALQFLLDGVARKEKVFYVTLSETKAELEQVAQSHGWSLDGIHLLELESIEERLKPDEQYTIFHPSEVELGETTRRIFDEVEKLQPDRVVFDSLSEMRLLARDPLPYRRHILALKQFFSGRKGTVLLLDDRTAPGDDLQLQSICHGVVMLETLINDHGSTPRRLRIIKMRGVKFQEGYHDFAIKMGGLRVFPRLIASLMRHDEEGAQKGRVAALSGIPELDKLTGGGIDHGSSVLLLGPAGCGKSTIATQYVYEAAKRGDRAACYLFEEGKASFLKRSAGIGLDMTPYINTRHIFVHQVDPAELSPGEFAERVKNDVVTNKTSLVLIDSLNGYLNAMPNQKYLLMQMHELLSYLNDHGVLTLFTLVQHGMIGNNMATPVDVSYLADSIILLRYFEAQGKIRKAISVMKKRSGSHEDMIREFRISAQGIQLGEPLSDFQGVLTGVPTYTGKAAPILSGK